MLVCRRSSSGTRDAERPPIRSHSFGAHHAKPGRLLVVGVKRVASRSIGGDSKGPPEIERLVIARDLRRAHPLSDPDGRDGG
jgi:hypothetical protein